MPLFRNVQSKGMGFSDTWLEKMTAMARQYEKMLEKYREINV